MTRRLLREIEEEQKQKELSVMLDGKKDDSSQKEDSKTK